MSGSLKAWCEAIECIDRSSDAQTQCAKFEAALRELLQAWPDCDVERDANGWYKNDAVDAAVQELTTVWPLKYSAGAVNDRDRIKQWLLSVDDGITVGRSMVVVPLALRWALRDTDLNVDYSLESSRTTVKRFTRVILRWNRASEKQVRDV